MEDKQLTPKQQEDIISEWNSREENPPSLLELIKIAYPNEKVDGRSKKGRLVKEFLATRKIKARGAHQYKAKEKIELSDEHEEFVRNNAQVMSATEIARIIFANNEITPLHQEPRTVNEYIKTLNFEPYESPQNIPSSTYKPPGTFDRTLSRINKYIYQSLEKSKMVPKEKKDVESTMGYLNTYRFTHQINSYSSQTSRDLFESSFIRYTYDKYDLTQEEVDQYIILSTEVVIASDIQHRVGRLQDLLDDVANDTEGRRISMSLVDAIGGSQTEYNQCINRQHKLLGDLKQKRSDRLKNQLGATASILNLVEVWKEEKTRKKLLKLADLRKKTIKDEMGSLMEMGELKAKILGLTEGEVLDE